MLSYLYACARDRYLKASELLGAHTELRQPVEQKMSPVRGGLGFDHRVLQHAHDLIAAYFHFGIDDRGHLPLPLEPGTYRDLLREKWIGYFQAEAEDLAAISEANVAILGAVVWANSERGMACERQLLDLLKRRYGNFSSRS